MLGGAYLCFEGYEKVLELGKPTAESSEAPLPSPPASARTAEDAKVASAIRTDMILSAEIMAISLAAIETPGFWSETIILAVVAVLVTVMVYGVVALIVKADDVGVLLARQGRLAVTRAIGRGLVTGMPAFLKLLGLVGMAAMLWVGGGIILHGLEEYGLGAVSHAIHSIAKTTGGALGPVGGLVSWLVDAAGAGIIGLAVGAVVARIAHLAVD